MRIFTHWAQIHRITRLVITTRTTEPQAFVYGNGFNQTEVIIHMNAVNDLNQEITHIPSSALLQHSTLLDFVRGDEMVDGTDLPPAARESVWSFSLVDNGFNFEPPAPAGENGNNPPLPVVNVNAAVASFFVMCGPLTPARTRQVAAQVTLTDPTAPISLYQTNLTGTPDFASQVAVTALDPIDYSLARNRRVLQGVGSTERTNIVWQSRTGSNPVEERTDGTRTRHYVRITPANGQFRSVENLSGVITDDNIFREFENWNGQQVIGFTGLGSQFPLAVLGRGAQFVPYQVNYWYLNPVSTQISGHYLGQPLTGFNPPACLVFPRLTPDEVIAGNDPGMLVCYKFTVSANNMFPFAWFSAERYGLTLRLTDRYGNSGFVSLTLDAVDWFDAPRVL